DELPVELGEIDVTVADRHTATRPAATHGVDLLVEIARVPPDRLAGLDVEREDVAGARREICDPVVDERLRLARILERRRRLQMDAPDAFQLADVRTIDLVERRVTLIEDRPAVRDPVLLRV